MSRWVGAIWTMVSSVPDRGRWFWTLVLREIRLLHHSLVPFSFSLDTPPAHDQYSSTSPHWQAVLPEYGYMFQTQKECYDRPAQLPAIYSRIGLGVCQGEVVVFLQMAVGERRWTVSRLRSENLAQLPDSILSDLYLAQCFLRLFRTQSDLVMTGLQTKGAIELMKSLCPLADNLDKLLTSEEGGNSPLIGETLGFQRQQSRCSLRCLVNQKYQRESPPQSSTETEGGQQ